MKVSELYGELTNWLTAEAIRFVPEPGSPGLHIRVILDHALVHVALLCEESPLLLRAIGGFPLRVPADKLAATGLLLHQLNVRVRLGAFYLLQDDRVVTYRLSQPLLPAADLRQQFAAVFQTTIQTLEDNLPALALFLCSTTEARTALAQLNPEGADPTAVSRQPGSHLELN